MTDLIKTLEERGFVDAMTSEKLRTACNQPQKVYCGFDPTAESLHLGNMIALMGLAWFQRFGHTPVAVVGGATGMVGDPSGKSHERPILTEETLEKNLNGIKENLQTFLDFEKEGCKPLILNNYDWFRDFSFVHFLRDVGKYFRVGPMLAKESVKARLNSAEGMSFTEFSYQVLQAYDFLYLYKNHQVTVQIGGSDQWGNITAGTELIRKQIGEERSAYGMTFPLLTRSDGKKFGKSESGAIWLSPKMLSPYEFYQYIFRVPDADVIKMLKMLTFLPMEDIHEIQKKMQDEDYSPNEAQKILAKEVTKIVHGEEGLQTALKVTGSITPGSETILDRTTLEAIAKDMPSLTLDSGDLLKQKLIDVLLLSKMLSSKGEARRLIRNGGVYLNNQKVEDENQIILENDLIEREMILLAVGKKKKMLLRTLL
jgi:tyrosyl-tRNA synthetase